MVGPVQGCFIILANFATIAFAALQNVTIDDAILTGTVVPQYLPSVSSWDQGNGCTKCLAKPDPSQAYDGTWHDATFHPEDKVSRGIEFMFTGSALYIFFILANAVPHASTLTDLVFYLDGTAVGTFVHAPTTSADYQYNVPVYANESLTFGEHSMLIQPIDTGNSVLMLFDYLVYTTDADNTTTTGPVSLPPSASPSVPSSPSPSPTSPGTQGTSSGQNSAAIAGGTVGGISALALVIAFSLCYRRYKRGKGGRHPSPREGAVLGSLVSFHETAEGTALPFYQTGSPRPELQSKGRRTQTSPTTLRPTSFPISIDPPSTASLPDNDASLQAQVEQLRDEVARLRRLHNHNQKLVVWGEENPPEYA